MEVPLTLRNDGIFNLAFIMYDGTTINFVIIYSPPLQYYILLACTMISSRDTSRMYETQGAIYTILYPSDGLIFAIKDLGSPSSTEKGKQSLKDDLSLNMA